MPTPTFMQNDTWKRAQDLAFQNRVQEDIHKLAWPQMVQDGIDGIKQLGASIMQPIATPKPDVEMLKAPEPLPIVISDRPEMPDMQQQAAPSRNEGLTSSPNVATPQGLNVSAGGKAARYAALIDQVAREEGVPPDVLAALLDTEDSDEASVSPAGAAGIMQVVPGQGFDLPGEDARDPLTSLRQGARAIKAKYQATGDWDEAGAAYFGYGTDAGGMTTDRYRQRYVENRRRYQGGQPAAPVQQAPGQQAAPQVQAAPQAQPQQPLTPQGQTAGRSWGEYTPDNLTPNQIDESTNAGLDWDTAMATCGVAAAIAFARANGRTPTWSEAMQLAKAAGWTKELGMSRGTSGQIELLGSLGIKARAEGVDPARIAQAIQGGQPVIINAHGNGGHFYVATAVRQGPNGLEFNFGNSAAILKRSGGRTWFRLDELPALGVGIPSEAIYMGGG